ncbi:Hsp70 family protein [Longimicrobium sp.]|uniref:Hsp70 family protein n=1 Tax=Longimicrobium sp. TaxID=2029185 RepID=UPI002E356DB4|nr:Hsp70 family protein [Longimicrobium sp.]HEX6039849.1 Hsp70 family protein [Longimicrobium sp.]
MGRVIGIDLGTSNSCVSVMDRGVAIVIPNQIGNLLTPSVVRLLENGTAVVGEHALKAAVTDPRHTITGIKRLIGRCYNEIADLVEPLPFDVIVGENNFAMVRAHGSEYSPQWISACILRSLRESAEAYLHAPVTQAVITVPAYFDERQRQATREAGALAGLEVLRVVTEPTAASLAYGLDRDQEELIAVFDLGGGTFDISILETGEGVFEVKAVNGDGYLGGDDFDERIVAWMVEEFYLDHAVDLSLVPDALERLRAEAVRGKCELSERPQTSLHVPFVAWKDGVPLSFEHTLTRTHFEEICGELFERLVDPCRQALEDAGWTGQDRACLGRRVLLVGGATRMPKIAEIVAQVFGLAPSRSLNPDETVANGAAVQAAVLEGALKHVLLLEAIPSSLGLEDGRGMSHRVLFRNATIPTKKTEVFSTCQDNQTSVEIHVLEGDRELAINNRTLLRFSLEGIDPAPAGTAQIAVTLDVDSTGVLHVEALDRASGRKERRRVTFGAGVTSHRRPASAS